MGTTSISLTSPTITIDTDDNIGASNCNTGLDNGVYTITAVDYNGSVWTDGVDTDVDDYYVIIRNSDTNCSSAQIPFSISDAAVTPAVSLSTVDNTDCSGTTPDGSITADVTNDDGGTYTFTWYVSATGDVGDTGASTELDGATAYNGTTPTTSDNGAFTDNVLEGLPANSAGETYWVRVTDGTDPSNSCYTDIDAIVIDDPADIVITATTISNSDPM